MFIIAQLLNYGQTIVLIALDKTLVLLYTQARNTNSCSWGGIAMKMKAHDLFTTVFSFALLIMVGISLIAIGSKLFLSKTPIVMAGLEYQYMQIVVEPGDTLWSIAKAQVPDEDPRNVVGSIRELNQLSSADIYPGQILTVSFKEHIQPMQLADGTIQ